jgi:NlpC/P60 family putative phage cell wall peptidase
MVQDIIIKEALEWVGTPYKHQASLKGKGSDCVGLLFGIWKTIYGKFPDDFVIPYYTPNWAEETKDNIMVNVCKKYLEEIPLNAYIPGDIMLYRMLRSAPVKHCAIVVSPDSIVHAYSGHGVIKTSLLHGRNSQLMHVFRFPEVS